MNTPARPKGAKPANSSCPEEKKIRTKYGFLNLADNSRHSEFKIRIIIRKGAGNAVCRNYIKRIIRKYLRDNRSKLQRFNDCTFYYQSKTPIDYIDIKKEIDNKIADLT
jgi:ribonuclease P protein component